MPPASRIAFAVLCTAVPLLFLSPRACAQSHPASPLPAFSSSVSPVAEDDDGGTGGGGQAEPSTLLEPERYGIEAVIGLNGLGVYVGKSFNRHVALRLGGNFTGYSGSFHDQGATIDGSIKFAYGKAELDLYPSGGNSRFHISPLLVFANNTRVKATALVDPATTLDFGNDTFQSSAADPLHGAGQIDLAHTAPGIAVGYGNITRGKGHLVFPVEAGFFYVGQPKLTVNFSGTACDITNPSYGCGKIQDDPDFQKDLAAFIARNNHNLSYAKFIPMVNVGIGYRF